MSRQKKKITPDYYDSLPIPRQLLDEQHVLPLAIGVYILLARQHLISGEAVPMSAGDLVRFDPSLSYGRARRALACLRDGQWVICEQQKRGQKVRYTPTWGVVKPKNGSAGADADDGPMVKPWVAGTRAMGRPGHVRTVRVEKSLLDDDIGRIAPNPDSVARITRHDGAPRGTLEAAGLAALGTLRQQQQPVVRQRGRVVPPPKATEPTPITPSTPPITPVVEVATPPITPVVEVATPPITPPAADTPPADAAAPAASSAASEAPKQAYSLSLFLGLIGQMFALLIGGVFATLIATNARLERWNTSLGSGSEGDRTEAARRKGNPANPANGEGEAEPTHHPGEEGVHPLPPAGTAAPDTFHQSESVTLLRKFGVSRHNANKLADVSPEMVRAAISLAQERTDIRNKPGYVVRTLRNELKRQQQATEEPTMPAAPAAPMPEPVPAAPEPAPAESELVRIFRQATGHQQPLSLQHVALIDSIEHADIWRDTCSWWVAVVDEHGKPKKRYNAGNLDALYDRYCQNAARCEATRTVSNAPLLYLPHELREEYLRRFEQAATRREQEAVVREAQAWLAAQNAPSAPESRPEPPGAAQPTMKVVRAAQMAQKPPQRAQEPVRNGDTDTPTWEHVESLCALARNKESNGQDATRVRHKIAELEQQLAARGEPRPASAPEPVEQAAPRRAPNLLDDYVPPPGASWAMVKELEQQALALEEQGTDAAQCWRELLLLEMYLKETE